MPTIEREGLTFDARPDRIDRRDLFYRAPLVSLEREFPPPATVERYLSKYCDDGMILEQGDQGACTGFGLAAVMNYLYWERVQRLDEGEPPPPRVSARMLYHMARLYDEWQGEDYEGSSCRGAMKGWHHHGVCDERLWPDGAKGKARFGRPESGWAEDATMRPLGAYYRIDRASLVDMQAAIQEVHAIYASATAHEGWWLKRTERLTAIEMASKEKVGGHAFAIVGYRPEGFIIQNSWGPGWGYRGFAVLTYADWLRHGMDAWVAVLGAPVAVRRTSIALSRTALQDLSRQTGDGRRSTVTHGAPETTPWAEDHAYRHAIVLGSHGAPLHRLLEAATAEDNVRLVAEAYPQKWLEERRGARLVVYAQGGLHDEEASIRAIRILAPYFEANGIYPLFITWRSGFGACLASLVEDEARSLGIDPDLPRGCRLSEERGHDVLEARDRAIEAAAERILAKALWTQMKQDAQAAAAASGGVGLLASHLARLKQAHGDLEIHLIGHSAGAILLGHLLERLTPRRTGIATMTLYAPACTVAFATRHYGRAFEKGLLDPGALALEILSDPLERADSVGPYGKSLLYLISRALDEVHKMPLLGLATVCNPTASRMDVFSRRRTSDIETWSKHWGRRASVRLVQDRQVFDGQGWIDAGHGAFERDVAVIGRTLERILGNAPRLKVESLRGL